MWTIAVNVNQNLLGKCMTVLNRPCVSVAEITPAEWADLQAQLKRLRVALDNLFEPDQYNYAFLMNVDPQVHLHIVPRYETARAWLGQQFDDPHWGDVFGSEQHALEPAGLERLRDEIRRRLPSMGQ